MIGRFSSLLARKWATLDPLRIVAAMLIWFGMASGAQAAITTFATFFERVGAPDFVFTNNSPTNATFSATSPIYFNYLNIAGLPADLQGVQLATITISQTTSAPATLSGGSVSQPFPVVATAITITRDTPAAEGSGSRTLLLQVTNNATLDGLNGSTSGSFNAATSTGQTVVFTSDFIDFTNAIISRDLAIALTQISPPLGLSGTSGAAGTFLNSFTAVASGNFSSDPVPRASTPVIAKSFSPSPNVAGSISTLTFTLSNANAAALTNVSFTDTYPLGLVNAIPPNVVNTCGGTLQGGVGGGNTIGLTGVSLPASGSCTITVNVTSALVNCYNNVSGVINSDQGAGNTAAATLCVTAAQPGVTTQASPGITLGDTIRDTATLSGGANPTGTLTFRLYGPNDATCTGAAIFTSTVPVTGNGSYLSGPFTPLAAGLYRWIANYNGDANNAATANACNAPNESVVVAPPGIAVTTQASPGVTLGGAVRDTATLSGGVNPTGTITFNLYGPNDATCSGAAIFTATVPVTGNGSYLSAPYTPTAPGTFRWIANYGGDANNAATTNACNAANESVLVAKVTTAVTTQASPGIALGGSITDTATLSGGLNPTGTITFRLYGPNDVSCTGAVVFTSNVPVTGNGSYTSTPPYTPTAVGTYRWIANYAGDNNNAATTNACNGANENVGVVAAAPAPGDANGDATAIPTMSEYALMLLAVLLGMSGLMAARNGAGHRTRPRK